MQHLKFSNCIKVNLVIIFLMLVAIQIVSAQKQFIGLKIGYTRTNISTNTSATYETQNNFSAGFSYDFQTKNNLLLGAELLYEKRGYNDKFNYTDQNGNTIKTYPMPTHFNYVSLPLKFGYSVGNSFYAFTNIGICPAFLLNETYSIPQFDQNLNYTGDKTFTTTKSNQSKFDLAALVEIGLGYKLTNNFSLEPSFRYQYSLTQKTNNLAQYNYNNYGVSAFLGVKYKFPENKSVK